jgi:hypothetical protein
MDEKKTELLAGLKGLSEEDLDAIAGGLDDIDQSLLNGIIAMAKSKGLSLDETIAVLESRATPDDEQKVAEYREYIMGAW